MVFCRQVVAKAGLTELTKKIIGHTGIIYLLRGGEGGRGFDVNLSNLFSTAKYHIHINADNKKILPPKIIICR